MFRIAKIVQAMRLRESVPFFGIAFLGGLMSLEPAEVFPPTTVLFTMAGTFLLAIFTFTFNDLQDVEYDIRSGFKSDRPLVSGSVYISSVRVISVTTMVAGLALLGIGTPLPVLCVGISTVIMAVAYSWRRTSLKKVPLISSMVHLAGGTLIFVAGAWSVIQPDPLSFMIGAYFGLVFAAGHLHHEVADFKADQESGVKTNAVRFGARPILWIGFTLWCLSCAHYSVLALQGIVPPITGWIQLGMFSRK